MNSNLLIHFKPEGGFFLCFRLLNVQFIGKHFTGKFSAALLESYMADWLKWPFLEGQDLANAEGAEKASKAKQLKTLEENQPHTQ